MKLKRFFALFVTVALMLTTIALPAQAEDKTYGCDNLNNEAGDLVIGFLGGSITVADGDSNSMGFNRYATRVTNWFQTKYPAKTVKQVNAGIGGTGSDLGKYRVMTDIGAHAPDVVFVEYAVNDIYYSKLYSESVRSNMETIVRTLQSLPKVPVIVFLYSMHDNSWGNLNYTTIPDHQAVADYYGIETINFYEHMSALVEKGDFIWDKTKAGSLTNDNIHPNALGHEQYGNYIISQLESRDILHKNNYGLSRKFMLSTKDTRDIKFADANATMTGTWEDSFAGQSDNKYEAIQSTATGDSISFTYTSAGNDSVGVTVLRGEGSYVIDEGTENEISGTFSVSDNNLPVVKTFASGLGAGEHTVKIVNTADGTEVPHLKLGRIIANGGIEVNQASTAANGDHIPASVPENRIIDCQQATFHSDSNTSSIDFSINSDDYTGNDCIYNFRTTADIPTGLYHGAAGIVMAKATEASQKGIIYDNYTQTAGTYVIRALVRTVAGSPKFGIATVNGGVGRIFDDTYGANGFTPGNEWEYYKATISPTRAPFTITMGLLNGSPGGDHALIDIGDGVYFAPEEAYDVSVKASAGSNVVGQGSIGTVFEAALLNQIEIPAKTLSQAFTWSVVDADGNNVEGLSVTPGASSNTATVSATDDVETGTYYLKAVSTAKNWQKTLEFTVEPLVSNTEDYVAKSANAIANPSNAENYNNFNTAAINPVTTTPGIYIWNVISETTAGAGHDGKMAGCLFKTVGGDFVDSNFKVAAGEKLILKMPVKNIGSTDSVRVNASLINSGAWGTANFSEEYGSDGVLVTDKDNWTILTFTLTMPGTAGTEYKPRLAFGFPAGVPAGSGIAINLSTQGVPQAFLGAEKPNDIRVTGASSSVAAGGSLDLAAEVFNSELDGEFTQSFEWVAVNTNRTNYVDGITFNPSNNGANVTVNVADTVAPGSYIIVAQDKTYGMNRQYPITVTASTYDVTELTLDTTANSATLSALTVNAAEDVLVIVAAFDGDKMVTAGKTILTAAGGVATLSQEDVAKLTLAGLSAGNKVRVFVWDAHYTPFTMKRAWKQPVVLTE